MAANMFATMLHRNTHKLTLILVYALLEWVLIFLLLLNSLFSYLIAKFAKYFGLKPPCQWCSRLDHFLEPNKNINPYRDLVCEAHAMEISALRYCSRHQNLVESQNMCTGCSSSQHTYNEKSVEISPKIAFFTWVSEKTIDHGEENHRCSCCDEKMNSKIYNPYVVLKPSWDILEYTQKLNLIAAAVDCDNNGGGESSSDTSESDCPERDFCHTPGERYSDDATMLQKCYIDDDESLEVMNLASRSGDYCDFCRLIPVELIDSSTVDSQTLDVVGNFVSEEWIETQVELVNEAKCTQAEAVKLPAVEEEDDFKLLRDETVSKTMIGTKVSDHELPTFSMDNEEAKITTGLDESIVEKDQGSKQLEKAIVEERSFLASNNHEGINHHLSSHLEPKELEEEKFSFASTYMDGLHQPHKKLLQFEKGEPGAEELWDGSMISEIDGDDGAFTIEQLRSALKAERKALSALYTELEEERSAAAIAANQTMAMITRVQEEKAAMQMEALQYQRMMEEQSEYDQEALQLLNELMIKREKEKQELEKELEVYRKKVLDYEAKDNLTMMMRRKSEELLIDQENGSFYAHQESSNNNSPANAFVDLEKMGLGCMNHLTTLDESLAEFEEERMSILEELKALEEKLFILADDEEQPFEHFTLDVKPVEHFTDDYGKVFDENYSFSSPEEIEISNEFSEDPNANHYPERKSMGSTSKKLLPLFDATGIESEEGEPNEEEEVKSHSTGVQNSLVNRIELGSKKVFIEEEVDHVYERLLALEADREFLKQCVSSLKKGDKGMDLLQEILQHLRDLRTVELRVRNIGDGPFTCSST